MTATTQREFPVDNASILFLSLLRPYHTNNFRFSAKLHSPICPELLQEAVNRLHLRFPSVVAGLRRDFFNYRQVTAPAPPRVQPDPGLLRPMTAAELRTCAFRVYYRDNWISIELFHALTDGSGAVVVLSALVQEYSSLARCRESSSPENSPSRLGQPLSCEVEDSYLRLADTPPRCLPSRFSYLLPRPADADWTVRTSALTLDAKLLLDAAHRHGVTLNTLLTTVLASSVMEFQIREKGNKQLKPVRLMVPANLRKLAGSRTLRNFSLYALPTLESHQHKLPLKELCAIIGQQLNEQFSPENLSGMASHNVRMQRAWYFRMLPWGLKRAALRLGYRFFGESNSSLTLTNLGVVKLPEEIQPLVEDFGCWMTPRVTSPYGCTVLSFGGKLTLNMSRFCPKDELGTLFFQKINALMAE